MNKYNFYDINISNLREAVAEQLASSYFGYACNQSVNMEAEAEDRNIARRAKIEYEQIVFDDDFINYMTAYMNKYCHNLFDYILEKPIYYLNEQNNDGEVEINDFESALFDHLNDVIAMFNNIFESRFSDKEKASYKVVENENLCRLYEDNKEMYWKLQEQEWPKIEKLLIEKYFPTDEEKKKFNVSTGEKRYLLKRLNK